MFRGFPCFFRLTFGQSKIIVSHHYPDSRCKEFVENRSHLVEVTRVLEEYAAKFDSLGLFQEKGVKSQKELLKNNARKEYEKKWYDYRQEVQNALGMTVVMDMRDEPDFIEAMKGQRMMSSVHNKLNTELARAKIALDGIALDYSEKLGWFHASPRPNIFHDLQSLVSRLPLEDFQSAVNSRIEKFEIEQKEKVLELAREQAVQNLTVAIEDVKDKVQDIHDKHNLIVDQVETFIALGGIPDDLITFVRVTLTRFVRWQNG